MPGAVVADLRAASLDLAGEGRAAPRRRRRCCCGAPRDCGRPRWRARSRWRARAPTPGWTPCSCGRTAASRSLPATARCVARHVTITGPATARRRHARTATLELRDAIVAGEFTAPLEGAVQGDAILGGPGLVDAAGRLPGRLAADRRGLAGGAGAGGVAGGPRPAPARGRRRRRRGRRARSRRLRAPARGVRRSRAATCCSIPAPRPAAHGRWRGGFTRERYGGFALPSGGRPARRSAAGPRSSRAGRRRARARHPARRRRRRGPGDRPRHRDGDALRAARADSAPMPDAGHAGGDVPRSGGRADPDRRARHADRGERGNATTLLPRSRTDAVPPLTRAVDVTMRATRVPDRADGSYADAYFDNVALTLAAPGRRRPAAPGPGDRRCAVRGRALDHRPGRAGPGAQARRAAARRCHDGDGRRAASACSRSPRASRRAGCAFTAGRGGEHPPGRDQARGDPGSTGVRAAWCASVGGCGCCVYVVRPRRAGAHPPVDDPADGPVAQGAQEAEDTSSLSHSGGQRPRGHRALGVVGEPAPGERERGAVAEDAREVLDRGQQRDARADLEVGGVGLLAAEDAVGDPAVDRGRGGGARCARSARTAASRRRR